ncbi:unnamed protein product [Calypogeia fissa]
MSGQLFKESCDADYAEMREICDRVKSVLWNITYVRNESGEDLPRAIRFEECPLNANDESKVLCPFVKEEVHLDADRKLGRLQPNVLDQGEQAESAHHGDHKGLVASFGRLKGVVSDLSREIVQSLRKFCISE